jgi:ATP-dependent DNA helicase RecG
MTSKLPLRLDDLLRQRTVEGDRIEYKAGWNPDAVIKTLCAFANDFENLGGGYVVIGQDCDADGQPIFPPVGLPANRLDKIQRELLADCNLIQPSYFPILSVEQFEGRNLIVLWAPGGQNRPYKAPRSVVARTKEYHYYIRRYASTVEVKPNSEDEQELLRLTATVPFDDRQCRQADVDDLRLPLIQSYLKEVGSGLYRALSKTPLVELGRRMNIVDGSDEFVKPRNVGIMFFHDEPRKFLPGAQIDVVIFPDGPSGGELIEKTFHGPFHEQLRDALRYLQNNVIREKVVKRKDRAEATRLFNYPFPAVEEALVNAVYHRGYEQREPVEVRVNPDGIEIVSYPGPDASIRVESLNGDKIVARRYRNRRIGEFLKELGLTEGRCTGIPMIREAMAKNGSPPPKFSTDQGRTYFLVELPVRPKMEGVGQAHHEAHDEAHDELSAAEVSVLRFVADRSRNRREIGEHLGLESRSGHFYKAIDSLRNLGLIELTIPDKPRSKNQRMRITRQGRAWLDSQNQQRRAASEPKRVTGDQ